MSGDAILAIDQGTSGTKAIVAAPNEGILAIAEHPVRPRYLPDGGVEQDPQELLQSVLVCGSRAIESAGRSIDTIALANQGETVLAWDPQTGAPLSDAIVWQDRRAEALTRELADSREWVARRTGLVLDPYFSAPKMAWLRRNVTPRGVVTTSDSWLVHQLCGQFVTDASTASRSLLLNIESIEWDPDLLRLFDWTEEALPHVVDCDEIVGSTAAFGPVIDVGGLIVDQQAALLAEGCTMPGTAKCTFGTGAFLLANTGSTASYSEAGLTSSVAWRARDQTAYCLDGQVYTAASAVRWMTDLGLIDKPEDLDRKAASDPGGVLAVPSLAGLAAPWWRSDARASFLGMSLDTRPGHLILAVLQGIAAQVAELGSLVGKDLGRSLERLRVDGGLTQCRTLMQATSDLMQIPVDVYPSRHATALGAAAVGRLAAEPALDVADAVPQWAPAHTYEPRWSSDQAADYLSRWRVAARTTLELEASR